MPALGFYRRVFFCGLIAGLLSAIVFKIGGSAGLVGVLTQHTASIGMLAVMVGVNAALSFWALGPMLWRGRFRTMILLRLGVASTAATMFIGGMWLLAKKFNAPLGLDSAGIIQVFSQIFVVTWTAVFVVNYLIRDDTGKKLRSSR